MRCTILSLCLHALDGALFSLGQLCVARKFGTYKFKRISFPPGQTLTCNSVSHNP